MPHEKAPASDLRTADGARSRLQAEARARGLDPLVKYMIFHWALGALGGALTVTALLVLDPFGLWPLIHDSGLGVPAITGFMTLLGGLVCAAAVMFPPKTTIRRAGA